MDILEFHAKISSTNKEQRIDRLPEEAALFCLLNGLCNPDDILDIKLESGSIGVEFSNEQLAEYAYSKFENKNIPGVIVNPLYHIDTTRSNKSISISFKKI